MTPLQKVEKELAELQSTVLDLRIEVKQLKAEKSMEQVTGFFKDDPVMRETFRLDREQRERERRKEIAAMTKRGKAVKSRRQTSNAKAARS